MALQTSGPISANDINVELGRSGTAAFDINGTEERDLAGVASGTIDFADFYGASAGEVQVVSAVEFSIGYDQAYGYNDGGDGAINDGTFDLKGGAAIKQLWWDTADGVQFLLAGSHSNDGWTSLSINGQTFLRADASYVTATNTQWRWNGVTTNPMPNAQDYDAVFQE